MNELSNMLVESLEISDQAIQENARLRTKCASLEAQLTLQKSAAVSAPFSHEDLVKAASVLAETGYMQQNKTDQFVNACEKDPSVLLRTVEALCKEASLRNYSAQAPKSPARPVTIPNQGTAQTGFVPSKVQSVPGEFSRY